MVRYVTNMGSGLVWHYTSAEGLMGIVSRHCIWATSARFLNDRNELRTNLLALQETYERVKASFSTDECRVLVQAFDERKDVGDAFVASASEMSDLLTLWRFYASKGTSPFSIGFDSSVELGAYEQDASEKHPSPPPGYYEDAMDVDDNNQPFSLYNPNQAWSLTSDWERVSYVPRNGNDSHAAYLRMEAARRLDPKGGRRVWLNMPLGAIGLEKDEAFEDEREVRLISTVQPDWRFVKYRSGDFGITPYVELRAGVGEEGFVPHNTHTILPIRKIMIGPSNENRENSKRALRGLLDANGYGEVEIAVSEIPFR